MIPGKNNAPGDWNPMGAAQKSTEDSTTFADDARFAAQALGIGELFEGGGVREIPSVLGASALGLAALLALGLGL